MNVSQFYDELIGRSVIVVFNKSGKAEQLSAVLVGFDANNVLLESQFPKHKIILGGFSVVAIEEVVEPTPTVKSVRGLSKV